MTPEDDLLETGRRLVQDARTDAASLARIYPAPVRDDEGVPTDPHSVERLQLAWALQYDARPDDAGQIRSLFEAEVCWRERDPLQGIGETLEIAGWLLARERRVENVWLLWRAKCANFDTECGFDRVHLVAAGSSETLAHVRASEHEDAKNLLDALSDERGAPLFDDATVEAWHDGATLRFARSPHEEPSEVWLDRALAVGRRDIARIFLDRWASAQERTPGFLDSLAYRLEELEDWAAAVHAIGERVRLLDPPARSSQTTSCVAMEPNPYDFAKIPALGRI